MLPSSGAPDQISKVLRKLLLIRSHILRQKRMDWSQIWPRISSNTSHQNRSKRNKPVAKNISLGPLRLEWQEFGHDQRILLECCPSDSTLYPALRYFIYSEIQMAMGQHPVPPMNPKKPSFKRFAIYAIGFDQPNPSRRAPDNSRPAFSCPSPRVEEVGCAPLPPPLPEQSKNRAYWDLVLLKLLFAGLTSWWAT